ncbi:MAG: nickel pincer cofactor biosynthesis protein LarC [Deltaproteobacteria bacterium]|nr:nickel pincer cofactor biosynthesis protein LarC [Candidatus Anaeroferrophillacea bacterium]
MMKILFIDCFSGISGDMFLAACLDLGFPPERLQASLEPFGLGREFRLDIGRGHRHGIAGMKFTVVPLDQAPKHHRSWQEIRARLEAAGLDPVVRDRAVDIFTRLATAEAAVHGTTLEAVHFHEVGALDSIADIVGIAAALHWFAPDRVIAAPPALGRGLTTCAHGHIPVPVPAVVELLRGMPVLQTAIGHELTTPTGAAVLGAVVDEFVTAALPLAWTMDASGTGIGDRDLAEQPNILRLFTGTMAAIPMATREMIVRLTARVDDMTGEELGALRAELAAAGALDVVFLPAQMKKDRPGTVIEVLVSPAAEARLVEALFNHAATLGVTREYVQRWRLERVVKTVATPWGPVRLKTARLPDGTVVRVKPEYDDLRRIARDHGLSLAEARRLVLGKADIS